MTDEEAMQMEEAKAVAEQEARAAVSDAKRGGETNPTVLKELFDTTYKQVLARELGVEVN